MGGRLGWFVVDKHIIGIETVIDKLSRKSNKACVDKGSEIYNKLMKL